MIHSNAYNEHAISGELGFIQAEKFFSDKAPNFRVAGTISYRVEDQLLENGEPNPVCKKGRIFRLGPEGRPLLIAFCRPMLWNIRFKPEYTCGWHFQDRNIDTMLFPSMEAYISALDEEEQCFWSVDFIDSSPDFLVLQSVRFRCSDDLIQQRYGHVALRLYVSRIKFSIRAFRQFEVASGQSSICTIAGAEQLRDKAGRESVTCCDTTQLHSNCLTASLNERIVWSTWENGLSFGDSSVIFSTEIPTHAQFVGFGEQNGGSLLKQRTWMNFLNYDNMLYNGVYGRGPLDSREPLYHVEPFWIEMNGRPGCSSSVATFVNNVSQTCVDFAVTSTQRMRVATCFGGLDYYIMAGDSVSALLRNYTSLVGRCSLSPRYTLGHHQGCYGYDTQSKVEYIARSYREADIPLDGIHIDVDIQNNFRTFTVDDKKFPQIRKMFNMLRQEGIKCSTNITPIINSEACEWYKTLNEGLERGYFIRDKRGNESRNAVTPGGNTFPGTSSAGKQIYRGGIFYGQGLGFSGHYPNFCNKEIQEWWGMQSSCLLNAGLEFIWLDMTSPCVAEEYGNMKGFPYRLMLETTNTHSYSGGVTRKPAITIWSLYSHYLHQATFNGLARQPIREGKRNFIISRGGFAGLQRHAGLWTGDNASTWDFMRVSIVQVLSLGMCGHCMVGADVGGYMPFENERYADPELIIRWYCVASMLPWFRNHYNGKQETGMKWFQEPFIYEDHFYNHEEELKSERSIYLAVRILCRHYIKLRYSLLQLMYDAMFENQWTALPIVRPLFIFDPVDETLYGKRQNASFLNSQFYLGSSILVAPVLERQHHCHGVREVYLPMHFGWYHFNLGLDVCSATPLLSSIQGGEYMEVDASIQGYESHPPRIMPMFIREGAIIPQIQVRHNVTDWTRPEEKNKQCNPITLHVYPGRDNAYNLYLDDGVSLNSAVSGLGFNHQPEINTKAQGRFRNSIRYDSGSEQTNKYRKVEVSQLTVYKGSTCTRTVLVETTWDGYGSANTRRDIGEEFSVILWDDPMQSRAAREVPTISGTHRGRARFDSSMNATIIHIPVEADHETGFIRIEAVYNLAATDPTRGSPFGCSNHETGQR